eukprot:TRINITY_DN283_c0_g1_i6.p1 TRINITY_DN283_c0_g1~~TRINITY_DN283_c0_g1_i6.p1  ORF type:complete len:149 (+),score=25.60 TRINITY_DN283_c0_g1_i6:144-590(+)
MTPQKLLAKRQRERFGSSISTNQEEGSLGRKDRNLSDKLSNFENLNSPQSYSDDGTCSLKRKDLSGDKYIGVDSPLGSEEETGEHFEEKEERMESEGEQDDGEKVVESEAASIMWSMKDEFKMKVWSLLCPQFELTSADKIRAAAHAC